MSSKTKIVVLHMKEIIYTTIFIVLGILLILLLVFMFFPPNKKESMTDRQYVPGIYTSTVALNNQNLEVEVSVDARSINSVRITNLDETVSAMYPLLKPAIEEIAVQISKSQSTENLKFSEENAYTSQILVNAVEDALKKAVVE